MQVQEHALRHLAWLRQDDPTIGRLLDEWSEALSDYIPEPFWAFGGLPLELDCIAPHSYHLYAQAVAQVPSADGGRLNGRQGRPVLLIYDPRMPQRLHQTPDAGKVDLTSSKLDELDVL